MVRIFAFAPAVLAVVSYFGTVTAFVPLHAKGASLTSGRQPSRVHLMDPSRIAEAIGTSEKVAKGFLSGTIDPKDMPVALLRAELDLKFVP